MTKARRKRRTVAKKPNAPKPKSRGRNAAKKRSALKPKSRRKDASATSGSRPVRKRPRPEKAAIRSEAFAKAILDAKSYASDPDSLLALFEEASGKAAAIPRASLNELGPYLQAMLRLIRAYARGAYTGIPRDALLTIVAAVSYLVDPFDLIPDEIPFLGFVDDGTVIAFAVSRTRHALDEFMVWETRGA
jgi:uncharacterized membrane protein YkvA (DUF1232 family)